MDRNKWVEHCAAPLSAPEGWRPDADAARARFEARVSRPIGRKDFAAQPRIAGAGSRNPAPDFTLRDAKGAPVSLSGYRGKLVLLDFWATWCGGCKVEIPWFMEFEDGYKDCGLALDADGGKLVKPFVA